MNREMIARELVAVARLLAKGDAPEDVAEEIYQKSLERPYWREVSRRFPGYNGDMDQAADAADWLMEEITDDFKRDYRRGWSKIADKLWDMVVAGLT